MKLYTHPGSCSSAAHICILESGTACEIVKVNLRGDRKLPDGRHLNDINPKGYVPALELDDGEVLTENVALLQYIADTNPAAGLAPPHGSMERLRLQEWLGFVNSELHKTLGPLFAPTTPEAMKAPTLEKFMTRLAYVEQHLEGKSFLLGEQFTVPDAYLFIVLSWTPAFELDLSSLPNVTAFQERVAARDTVKTVKAAAAA